MTPSIINNQGQSAVNQERALWNQLGHCLTDSWVPVTPSNQGDGELSACRQQRNQRRAQRVEQHLRLYADQVEDDGVNFFSMLGFVIDLRHYCWQHHYDFNDLVNVSSEHYHMECDPNFTDEEAFSEADIEEVLVIS